jgi:glycosyltransferase involved in cell wall biosynthesis
MKYSIVIPTYNHCDDLLKPCVESIFKNSNMQDVELIISANGCTDGTKWYLESLKHQFKSLGFEKHFKVVWSDTPSGYPKATNDGIKLATTDKIVLLNNDCVLLEEGFQHNLWLDMLESSFLQNEKCGISGPVITYLPEIERNFAIFFCVMIDRKVFNTIGLLNEEYGTGTGEDVEFCIEAENAGFEIVECTASHTARLGQHGGLFPIYHIGQRTIHDETLVKNSSNTIIENHKKIVKKYGSLIDGGEIKLNLGCGSKLMPGFVNVDLYNPDAELKMDVRKLNLKDNTAQELHAYHVFEHFSPFEVNDILTEWLRVLKPGGKLVMEMPDLLENCKRFEESDKNGKYQLLNCIYGTTMPKGVPGHLFGWYDEILFDHLYLNGFVNINIYPIESDHWGYNLRAEAMKPL